MWLRLEVEQGVMDLFMEMNRGCGEAVIKAVSLLLHWREELIDRQYEVELERILEIRRSSLSSFVVFARKEIEMLWSALMLSEDEKDFGPLIDGMPLIKHVDTEVDTRQMITLRISCMLTRRKRIGCEQKSRARPRCCPKSENGTP